MNRRDTVLALAALAAAAWSRASLGQELDKVWRVGYGTNKEGKIVGFYVSETNPRDHHAFIYTPGKGTIDIAARGWHSADAWAINDNNQVTGEADCGAFVYTPGQEMKRISPECATGRAINERGDVTGEFLSFHQGTGNYHAFVYTSERGFRDLGTLGGCCSFAYGINRHGQIVGAAAFTNQDIHHAFIYFPDAGMYDLNTLVPLESGWDLIEARAINDRGQVAGWGILGGAKRVFVLTPVPK